MGQAGPCGGLLVDMGHELGERQSGQSEGLSAGPWRGVYMRGRPVIWWLQLGSEEELARSGYGDQAREQLTQQHAPEWCMVGQEKGQRPQAGYDGPGQDGGQAKPSNPGRRRSCVGLATWRGLAERGRPG